MEITSITITMHGESKSAVRAFVVVTFDNTLVIRDIVITGLGASERVVMPHRMTHKGNYKDVIFIKDSKFQRILEKRIFDEYRRVK